MNSIDSHGEESLSSEARIQRARETIEAELQRLEQLFSGNTALTLEEILRLRVTHANGEPALESELFKTTLERVRWVDEEDEEIEDHAVPGGRTYTDLDEFKRDLETNNGTQSNFLTYFEAKRIDIAEPPQSWEFETMSSVNGVSPPLLRAEAVAPELIGNLRTIITNLRSRTGRGDYFSSLEGDDVTIRGLMAAYNLMARLITVGDKRKHAKLIGISSYPVARDVTNAHEFLTA